MIKQGYATLGVALCAALGVHILILLYLSANQTATTQPIEPIQVDIVPLQVVANPKPSQATMETTGTRVPETKVNVQSTSKEADVSSQTDTNQTHTEVAYIQEASMQPDPQKEQMLESLVLPEHMQQSIVSHIQYPRQARRRGWEGKAEFELAVSNQLVAKVTMLTSSGYMALDKAAERGIASIRALPLKDGSYRLPIEFRLQ